MSTAHGMKFFRALFKSQSRPLNFQFGKWREAADPTAILRRTGGAWVLPTVGSDFYFFHQTLKANKMRRYEYWIATPTVILHSGEDLVFCWALAAPVSLAEPFHEEKHALDYVMSHLPMTVDDSVPIPGSEWNIIQCDGSISYTAVALADACTAAIRHRAENPTANPPPFLPLVVPR